MGNLFDSANYPETEPTVIIAGDRIAWKRIDLGQDYDPALYALSYEARLEGDGTKKISISASESGTDYIVEIPIATSKDYVVGAYHWSAYITRQSDSERITVDSGTWSVEANKALSTADPRTHAKKVLEAIEAVIESRATKDQESYTIGNRSLGRTPIGELLKLRDRYRTEVQNQEIAEKVANGLGNPRRIGVRFGRV